MFYPLFLLLFVFLLNQKVIAMSPSVKIKLIPSFSYKNIYTCKQRLYNTFLRILVYNTDYKTIKQKVNNTYQEFLTNYYNNCQRYYSIDETDLFIIDNLVQLIL